MGRLRAAGAWSLVVSIGLVAGDGSVGCGSPACREQAYVGLVGPISGAGEQCLVTAQGTSGLPAVAVYSFPPWTGQDTPCTTLQGPKPAHCARSHGQDNGPQEIFSIDYSADPYFNDAKTFFASDKVTAQLQCNRQPVAQDSFAFSCSVPL